MKKHNGYMIPTRRRKIPKKFICATCGKSLTPKEAYCYVDPNNCAITDNALPYCRECYKKKFGE